jgi:hypothetical protein
MRFLNQLAVTGANIATSTNSTAFDGSYLVKASTLATFTGTPAGTIELQASNDDAPYTGNDAALFTPTNWVLIPNTNVTVSGAGSVLIPAVDICYQYIRVSFIATGGSAGTMNVRLKTVGF